MSQTSIEQLVKNAAQRLNESLAFAAPEMQGFHILNAMQDLAADVQYEMEQANG